MSMPEKRLLRPERVRQLPEQFSWIDRSWVRRGLLQGLPAETIALYFFLVTVADRLGLSFYSDRRICEILSMDAESLRRSRADLVREDLVAYSYPLYQVLEVPIPRALPPAAVSVPRGGGMQSLGQVLSQMGRSFDEKDTFSGGRHEG
jgi:hypothetical protein